MKNKDKYMLTQINYELELIRNNVTNSVFNKLQYYALNTYDLLSQLSYKNIVVKIVDNDVVVFTIEYSDTLEILIVRSFEDDIESEDDHNPIITLMEGKCIIFQNRLSIDNLVKSLLEAEIKTTV